MTQAENTKIKAFTRKMRDEGADGFAAGPWDTEELPESIHQRQQSRWGLQSARLRRRQRRVFTDRLLTWAAITALITLTVGIVGTWLSYQPNPGAFVTRPNSLNKTTLERFETRLQLVEERLSTILEPYVSKLNDLDSRLKETSGELSARIRILETAGTLTETENTYEARLQLLETQLSNTMARLDEISLMLAALNDSRPGPPGETRFSEPAAQEYDRFAATSPTADVPDTAWPGSPEPGWDAPAQGNPFMPAPSRVDGLAQKTTSVAQMRPHAEVPAEVPAGQTASAEQIAQPPAPLSTLPVDRPEAAPPAPAPAAAPQPAAEPAPVRTGDWVINIASYINEKTAQRKLAEMQKRGVDVELVSAEVNGRTVYRARVFGFATRQAAMAQAGVIREKLGLKETWIAKR